MATMADAHAEGWATVTHRRCPHQVQFLEGPWNGARACVYRTASVNSSSAPHRVWTQSFFSYSPTPDPNLLLFPRGGTVSPDSLQSAWTPPSETPLLQNSSDSSGWSQFQLWRPSYSAWISTWQLPSRDHSSSSLILWELFQLKWLSRKLQIQNLPWQGRWQQSGVPGCRRSSWSRRPQWPLTWDIKPGWLFSAFLSTHTRGFE